MIMDINQPLELNRESLYQLAQGELVDIVPIAGFVHPRTKKNNYRA